MRLEMSKLRKMVLMPSEEADGHSTKAVIPSKSYVRNDNLNKEAAIEWSRNEARHAEPQKRPTSDIVRAKILAIPDRAARGEALGMLSILSKNPFTDWDKLGNISIYGNYLPGANLADLIRHSVYRRKSRKTGKVVKP